MAPVLAVLVPKLRVPSDIKAEQLSCDPAVGEAYFADKLVTDTLAVTAAFGKNALALMSRAQDPARMRAVDVPVLLYHGDADTLVPMRASEMLAAALPNVTFERLAGARHEPHNEPKGDELMQRVADFLKGVLEK